MFQKHFAAALDQPSLSDRRGGQMRELPAPDWFVRHGFIRAFTPEQAELRITLHGAGVGDLDWVAAFVEAHGLGLGLGHPANAFEIKQNGVVDLQLHAAFAGGMEGIIPAQIDINEALVGGGKPATGHVGRRWLAFGHVQPQIGRHRHGAGVAHLPSQSQAGLGLCVLRPTREG